VCLCVCVCVCDIVLARCIWNHTIDCVAHTVIALALLTAAWGVQAPAVCVIHCVEQRAAAGPSYTKPPGGEVSWLKPLKPRPPHPHPHLPSAQNPSSCVCVCVCVCARGRMHVSLWEHVPCVCVYNVAFVSFECTFTQWVCACASVVTVGSHSLCAKSLCAKSISMKPNVCI